MFMSMQTFTCQEGLEKEVLMLGSNLISAIMLLLKVPTASVNNGPL